jgi:integrase
VQTITVDDVQGFVDALVGRGLSPKSVKGIASALSQILKLARRKDLIRFNPAEDVELPSAKAKQVRPPSPAAIWAAIEKAMERGEPDRAAIIRLQAATGMRRGEVAGLRWVDVDLDGEPPQLTIERAIADLRGNGDGPLPREVKSTKTETGIRTIGIDAETAEALREHRARTEALAREFGFDGLPPDAFVFWPPREGPLVPYAPQSITKMYRTLAGQGGLRPHQLRHFSVTQLLAAGVPEVEVMGRHGHASASSMKPYRHYIRARDRMLTLAIANVLSDFAGKSD